MRRLLALALIASLPLGCSFLSPRTPDQIRAELMPLMGASALSIGTGANDVIVVGLRANAEAVARDIVARYGAAVSVTVGNFPYPRPETAGRSCQWIREVTDDHQPLEATLAIEPTVIAGAFFKGTVRLTNGGSAPYDLETSSGFTVYLFRPGETDPIASSEGAIAGTGYGQKLAPGGGADLEAGGGTASCDLAVGYVIPAGSYIARALVDYQEPVTFENRAFWSDPAPIDVVAP